MKATMHPSGSPENNPSNEDLEVRDPDLGRIAKTMLVGFAAMAIVVGGWKVVSDDENCPTNIDTAAENCEAVPTGE
ncbi:MAG: hypothetical protein U5K77_04175 [Candidatus Saccharibacteria bacterium]|nr:hypothetical protein [Candidatus Saccharibacteria bacterium]